MPIQNVPERQSLTLPLPGRESSFVGQLLGLLQQHGYAINQLIASGLPGDRNFEESGLADGDIPIWNGTAEKWSVVSKGSLLTQAAGVYEFTSGTETVLTLTNAQSYLLYSRQDEYGTGDFRHGKLALAGAWSTNDAALTTVAELDAAEPGSFSLSGMDVQYSAGSGIPATPIYYWRLT